MSGKSSMVQTFNGDGKRPTRIQISLTRPPVGGDLDQLIEDVRRACQAEAEGRFGPPPEGSPSADGSGSSTTRKRRAKPTAKKARSRKGRATAD